MATNNCQKKDVLTSVSGGFADLEACFLSDESQSQATEGLQKREALSPEIGTHSSDPNTARLHGNRFSQC